MSTDPMRSESCPPRPAGIGYGAAFFFIAFSLFLMYSAWHEHGGWRAQSAAAPTVAAAGVPASLPPFAHREIQHRKTAATERKESHAAVYRRLGAYVARRFRISAIIATEIVTKAHAVGHQLKLDPLLILAVISVESRFDPTAQSNMGAMGLMQVMPRWHADKLEAVGGEERIFELEPNIMVGARILKEYLLPTGEIADALQRYLGATSEEMANEYADKVTREREIFDYVARKGVAPGTPL